MPASNQPQKQSEITALEAFSDYLEMPSVLLPALGIVTLLLYSGTIFFEFVWDDWPQIVNNPLIRSWHNLPQAFGSDLWYHVARQQVYYRPLFVIWSMLNFSLFGLHPWGWHLAAVLVHVGAVLSVFWLARKLGLEYWTAALAALIFALHPVHIEAVAWISAASDAMVTMFTALAFVAFLNAREITHRHRAAWRVASFAFLASALLTKEMAASFAALTGIYAWLNPAEKTGSPYQKVSRATFEALPYGLVTLAYAILRTYSLGKSGAAFDSAHGMLDMVRTLPLVLSIYFEKLLAPLGLTGYYYTPYVTSPTTLQFVVPASVLFVVGVLFWSWYRYDRDTVIAFSGLWLLVGLAPALYLRNFGNGDFVRDRYMYLPSIGFAILCAKGLRRLPAIHGLSARMVQGCAVGGLCLFYVGASLAQQVYWGNDLLVSLRGETLYPDNPNALVRLAAEYSERGANDRALELAQEAERRHPEYVYSLYAVAESNIRAGNFDEGRKWLDRFLASYPDFANSLSGKASLAGLYGRMGEYSRALALCDQILAREPNLYSAIYNCGNIRLLAGDYPGAKQLLRRAVQLEPLDAAPRHFLGRALFLAGQNQEADLYLKQAAAMDPKVWDYHYWLARSLEQSGNLPAARVEYQQTLRLNQESSEARLRLTALEGK